jgi:thiosulfate dehydrogenase (quinone) large subunit
LSSEVTPSLVRHALLPLRLFLGVTFVYAGLDKLADPHYLGGLADPASFASQAHAVAAHSPIGGLLDLAVRTPTPTGLLMAFGELAVGLGTLLGLWGRIAAAGGALVNLSLFLSVSWGVRPYYLGNDLAYLMAWLPLVLAGTPSFSLDALLARHAAAAPEGHGRRQVLVDGAIAALAVAGTGLLTGAAVARSRPRTSRAPSADAAPTPSAAPPSAPTPSAAPTASGPAGAAADGPSVPVASVPVGGGVRTAAPGSGDPVYVVQPVAGTYAAFSGVCTHAGCTVNPPKDGTFVCPCHNSCFDAATGAVLRGPATRALARVGITRTGDQLHLTD